MEGEELELIKDAFATNWIAPVGPHLSQFETQISEYLGEGIYTAALSSGTAALHLALQILNVGKGDVVICQSFTFAGTANPICYVGANPYFVDSERETWNMDPGLLEEAILDCLKNGIKPKAIIYVHLYGMPAKVDEIAQIANKYEVPLVEDAAEALGSMYKGQRVGVFGDLSVFSFNGNKIITTSGGGALVSKNRQYIEKAKFLATQARDEALHYQHSTIGYNYRLSNVCACIGVGQMKVIDKRISQRRTVFEWYMELFHGCDFVEFLDEPIGFYSNRWLTSIIIKDVSFKKELSDKFDSNNIEYRPLWKPMHMQPVFKDSLKTINNVSEFLFQYGICLPSGSNMGQDQKQRIEDIVVSLL